MYKELLPWYIAGPLIGLFVPLLLLVGNKLFGISSSFMHVCSLILPKSRSGFLNYDPAKHQWKFYFVIGILIGAFISSRLLLGGTVQYLPDNYYTLSGFSKLFIGGLLVGFGTRYANGCTSGHAITGIALLNPPSVWSTISFFAGGLVYTFIVVHL